MEVDKDRIMDNTCTSLERRQIHMSSLPALLCQVRGRKQMHAVSQQNLHRIIDSATPFSLFEAVSTTHLMAAAKHLLLSADADSY